MDLDRRVAELAERYRPLAVQILREAIRVPALATADGGEHDPLSGQSNHEGPRLHLLRQTIIDVGAVEHGDDVAIDAFGNLVWTVTDPLDGLAPHDKRVIHLDGHSDTVAPLVEQWQEKFGGALDPFDGLRDGARLDRAALRAELGYLPPDDEWQHLVFGRGAADQLAGVVAQVVATKIMLELRDEGSLRGCIVRAVATVAEEDNDGGGPRYLVNEVLPTAAPDQIPDVVILTEGTGDAVKGALGIYRGQRGRMQIEVVVTGRSCHGSMPQLGLNPLEHGSAIIAEAAARHARGEAMGDHPVVGRGTRTASWARLDTPSDCAVPDRFTFRFDRRLSVGETAEQAVAQIEALAAVATARADGLTVEVGVPRYTLPTWTGHAVDNEQVYPGWITPADHPAVLAAVDAYRRVVTPHVVEPDGGAHGGALRREPRVDTWVFSTDGVGFPVPCDAAPALAVPERKGWVTSGSVKHPPMLGIGAGIEQNTHRIGECVDERELQHAIAVLARFPSLFVARS